MITLREIKIKYKQSVLGFLWAILMPTIIVLAGLLVKFALSITSGKPLEFDDVAAVSVKAIPWAFFVSTIKFCANSLIGNANLVTKIYMPREVFPVASMLSQLFDLVVASVALAIVLSIAGIGASSKLLLVPVLLIILILFSTGIGIIVAAASLFFRDVKYLVDVFVTFAIFFTPVFYEVEMFGKWGTVMLFNPVAPVLEALRSCIVLQEMPPLNWIAYSGLMAVLTAAIGMALFKKLEPAFAESI